MLLNRRKMLITSTLLATGFIVGCRRDTESVFRVGTLPWRAYEPLLFAREQGYFPATFQVVEFASSPEIQRSFQNQAIEAATVTLDEALRLAQLQSDVRVIMAFALSNGADALLAKPEITSLAGLQGKRVGVELNAAGSFIFSRILEHAGLTRNDVIVVPITPLTTESAFHDGTVDAVITYEPFASRLKDAGANVLFDSTQIPGEIVDVMIVREQTLNQQAEELTQLLNGWFRAVELLSQPVTQPKAADEQLVSKEFSRTQQGMELLNYDRNMALLGSATEALSGTVRKLGASMQKYELLNQMIDPALLLDATILKQAKP